MEWHFHCPSFDLIKEFAYSLGRELPFGQPPSMGTVLKFLFSCRLICNRAGACVLWGRFSGTASSLEHSRALRGAFSIVLASKETSRLEAQLTCHLDPKGWEHPWASRENHRSPYCLPGHFGEIEKLELK